MLLVPDCCCVAPARSADKWQKVRKLSSAMKRYDMEREVRSECADDEPASNFDVELDPWWWLWPVLFLLPPTGVPG